MAGWTDETAPGIAATSYAADGRLLDELRGAWPPAAHDGLAERG